MQVRHTTLSESKWHIPFASYFRVVKTVLLANGHFAGVTPAIFVIFVDFRGPRSKIPCFCGQDAISKFSPIFVKTRGESTGQCYGRLGQCKQEMANFSWTCRGCLETKINSWTMPSGHPQKRNTEWQLSSSFKIGAARRINCFKFCQLTNIALGKEGEWGGKGREANGWDTSLKNGICSCKSLVLKSSYLQTGIVSTNLMSCWNNLICKKSQSFRCSSTSSAQFS